ncbi:MAG: hypothetical protein ABIH11_07455 [Candidatus Altiarchaeota archaeon]
MPELHYVMAALLPPTLAWIIFMAARRMLPVQARFHYRRPYDSQGLILHKQV